jgi:hypothetical protein
MGVFERLFMLLDAHSAATKQAMTWACLKKQTKASS